MHHGHARKKVSSLNVWRSGFGEEDDDDSDEDHHVGEIPEAAERKREVIGGTGEGDAIDEIGDAARKNPEQAVAIVSEAEHGKEDESKGCDVKKKQERQGYRDAERPGGILKMRDAEGAEMNKRLVECESCSNDVFKILIDEKHEGRNHTVTLHASISSYNQCSSRSRDVLADDAHR